MLLRAGMAVCLRGPVNSTLGRTFALVTFMADSEPSDLGFTYRRRKNGDVEILHHGRVATTLRGRDATDFLLEAPDPSDTDSQQLMARLTGNYKHGNERLAGLHPRNRR